MLGYSDERSDFMFEDLKLNIYRDKIEGFAYDMYATGWADYRIQTYLVINMDNGYGFIKYKKHKYNIRESMNDMADELVKIGYKPLAYWVIDKSKSKVRAKMDRSYDKNNSIRN